MKDFHRVQVAAWINAEPQRNGLSADSWCANGFLLRLTLKPTRLMLKNRMPFTLVMSLVTCSDGLGKAACEKSLRKVKEPSTLPSQNVMICERTMHSDIFEISDRLAYFCETSGITVCHARFAKRFLQWSPFEWAGFYQSILSIIMTIVDL